MNQIRAMTATIVAAISLFKVGDFSQGRTNNSYERNDKSYLSELVNNLDIELPQLKAPVTNQQQSQEGSANDLMVLFLVSSPILVLLFNNKKPEEPPSEEEKLGKALTEYLKKLKKD